MTSITDQDRRLLGELANRDEAVRHFTGTHSEQWLDRMERAGVIAISRPYSDRKYWSVGIMPGVPGITDDQGWLIED